MGVRTRRDPWVTGSKELVAAVRTTKQFLTHVASGPFQYAIAEALALPDTYYADFVLHHHRHRRTRPGHRRLTFCRALPELAGVVAVPDSVFHDHPTAGRTQVRFAFCKKHDVLADAAGRLRKAFTN
jgi:N-succinyldiaminopimelate aminotransferase